MKENENKNLIPIDKIGDVLDDKFQEWKKFAFQNRTIDTVIAFTLGLAFSKIVTAIAEGCVMPLIKFLGAFTGETWREMKWSPCVGLTFEVGKLYASAVDFLLASIILFVLWKLFVAVGEDAQKDEKTFWQRIKGALHWCTSWRIKIERLP